MKKLVLSLFVAIAALFFSGLPAFGVVCPAIGADSGCGLVITIGSGGILTITGPFQPPFDSADDTLIGVDNKSGSTQASIILDGGSIAVFAFDNDGLCTQSGAPVGCPFGPTFYEGPGITFSNINVGQTAGKVNFGGGGLLDGGSAFFSLEGNLKATDISSPVPEPASLALLGSSFLLVGTAVRRRRRGKPLLDGHSSAERAS